MKSLHMQETHHHNNVITPSVQKKWNQIYSLEPVMGGTPQPAQVLVDFSYLLPQTGRALDLACGKGGNALFLAESGLETWAWDISDVVLDQLSTCAKQTGLSVHAEVRDVECQPLPTACFNVIVVSRFLNRSICQQIIEMLAPGGLLFYQTFTIDALTMEIGPRNPDYLLKRNELLKLFDRMQLCGYREDGLIKTQKNNMHAQAYLVAQKIYPLGDDND